MEANSLTQRVVVHANVVVLVVADGAKEGDVEGVLCDGRGVGRGCVDERVEVVVVGVGVEGVAERRVEELVFVVVLVVEDVTRHGDDLSLEV